MNARNSAGSFVCFERRAFAIDHRHMHRNRRTHALRDGAEFLELRHGVIQMFQLRRRLAHRESHIDALHAQPASFIATSDGFRMRAQCARLLLELAQRKQQ